jgi:imidazolonepropionase-like amidohydrolase
MRIEAMASQLIGALLLLSMVGASAQEPASADPKRTAYVGAILIDGTGAPPKPGMAIIVLGEKIEALIPAKRFVPAKDIQIIDMRGQYVLPGLINSHVHLATPPHRKYALAMMRRSLYGGVTAVRSMADDARAIADLARAARVGEIPGPDIAYAALFAGPEFFHDPRVVSAAQGETAGKVPWMREVTANTNLSEAITLARGSGASAIKIYADLDASTVDKIVREAHRQGIRAWAHAAVFPASPLELANAAVDSMSHVCMIAYQGQAMPEAYHNRASVDETRFQQGIPDAVREVFERMKANGVILDSTNFVYETIERMRSEMPEGQGPPTYCSAALAERLSAEAVRAGVEISVGTDAFAVIDDAYPALQRELEILVQKAHMTPLKAIRSATLVGAKALDREKEMGSIEVGKLANLVFVSADPVADIGALRKVMLVVKRGIRYRREDYVPIGAAEMGE